MKNFNPYFKTHSDQRREYLLLGMILLLAFALRLGYVLFLKNHYFFYHAPSSDVLYYQKWAETIASGDWIGKEAFYGMPLYAYFLAVLKRLTLGNDALIRLIHLLLGTLNCALVYFLAKKIFTQGVAYLASFLCATNFILIYYDWLLMPVSLIIFLTLVILLFFVDTEQKQGKPKEWFLVGLLLGLTALGDGKMMLFFLFCLFLLFIDGKRQGPARLQKVIIPFALGFTMIITMVALRNKIISGNWILISAQTGLSFYVGNNPHSDGLYYNPEFIRPTHEGQDEDQRHFAEQIAQTELNPQQISTFWRDQAFRFIQNSPNDYLHLLNEKFLLFFKEIDSPDELDLLLQKEWKKALDLNSFYILCPLAMTGLFCAWRKKQKGIPWLSILILSQLIFTLIFFLTVRHRATVLPILIILESYFLWWFVEEWRSRSRLKPFLVTGILIVYWISFRPQELPASTIEYVRHANTGVAFAKEKKYKLAQAHYRKALEFQPFDTNTLYNLANSYFYDENYEQAQHYYEKVLTIFPLHIDARFNLGYMLEKKGELRRALTIFNELLRYQPHRLDILIHLLNINSQLGNCGEAQKIASTLIENQPSWTHDIQNLIRNCQRR